MAFQTAEGEVRDQEERKGRGLLEGALRFAPGAGCGMWADLRKCSFSLRRGYRLGLAGTQWLWMGCLATGGKNGTISFIIGGSSFTLNDSVVL